MNLGDRLTSFPTIIKIPMTRYLGGAPRSGSLRDSRLETLTRMIIARGYNDTTNIAFKLNFFQ
jgi:hypothetical protein